MANDQYVNNVLQGLEALQETPLSIIRLSEPISAAQTESNRSSDVSSSGCENPSPASLEADLSHYKELFSKLRFSYLEQVTKEKFLRAIVGDPPLIVEPAENAHLESQLLETKSILQAQKHHVAAMVVELDRRARDLSRRHETIQLQTVLLRTLPEQIGNLNAALEELRARNRKVSRYKNPGSEGRGEQNDDDDANDDDERLEMNLGLPATNKLIEERKARMAELDEQLKALRQGLPRQGRILEQEERELSKLEAEREQVVREAREAVERKREGGGVDELELRGRWLKSVEGAVREMLGV